MIVDFQSNPHNISKYGNSQVQLVDSTIQIKTVNLQQQNKQFNLFWFYPALSTPNAKLLNL